MDKESLANGFHTTSTKHHNALFWKALTLNVEIISFVRKWRLEVGAVDEMDGFVACLVKFSDCVFIAEIAKFAKSTRETELNASYWPISLVLHWKKHALKLMLRIINNLFDSNANSRSMSWFIIYTMYLQANLSPSWISREDFHFIEVVFLKLNLERIIF